MIVINLFGAPCSGKSTTAAGLFYLMKINKMRVELVREFASELILEKKFSVLEHDQMSVYEEQMKRVKRVAQNGDFDFVITDSPAFLSAFYDQQKDPDLLRLAQQEFNSMNNLNYFLQRAEHGFELIGRRHNEAQSKELDKDLKIFLKDHQIEYTEVTANPLTPQTILDDIRSRMEKPQSLPFSNLNDDRLL